MWACPLLAVALGANLAREAGVLAVAAVDPGSTGGRRRRRCSYQAVAGALALAVVTLVPAEQTLPHAPQSALLELRVGADAVPARPLVLRAPAHEPPKQNEPPDARVVARPAVEVVVGARDAAAAAGIMSGGHVLVQLPPAHTSPGGHAYAGPQPPQFAGFEWRSTQKPPQSCAPSGHVHEPPRQNEPPLHACPHIPQSEELFCVSTQALPHVFCHGVQLVSHEPELQTVSGAQAVSHDPQWDGSFARSTQTPLHLFIPAGQLQLPWMQSVPPVHAVPHPPQWFGSDCSSMHAPAHAVAGLGQSSAQVPFEHTLPFAHACPQRRRSWQGRSRARRTLRRRRSGPWGTCTLRRSTSSRRCTRRSPRSVRRPTSDRRTRARTP